MAEPNRHGECCWNWNYKIPEQDWLQAVLEIGVKCSFTNIAMVVSEAVHERNDLLWVDIDWPWNVTRCMSRDEFYSLAAVMDRQDYSLLFSWADELAESMR